MNNYPILTMMRDFEFAMLFSLINLRGIFKVHPDEGYF